jgi:lipoyl(octanoyl) transferase
MLVRHMGTKPLSAALGLERRLRNLLAAGEGTETLILAQHPEVFTLGSGGRRPKKRLPHPVRRVDREGGLLFQGPGQIAGYAVFDLGRRRLSALDVRKSMEGVLAEALRALGVKATRRGYANGLWAASKKLAFVSSRGFALNVNCDLSSFRFTSSRRWTSLQELLGKPLDEHVVAKAVAEAFLRYF